jgi:hypothetical protein
MDILQSVFRPHRDHVRSVEDGMADSGMSGSTLQPPPPAARRETVLRPFPAHEQS